MGGVIHQRLVRQLQDSPDEASVRHAGWRGAGDGFSEIVPAALQ